MGGYDGQNRNDVWYSTGVTGVTEARKARGLVHAPTTLVARSGNYSCSSRTELYDSDGKLAAVLQVGQNGLNVSPGVYFAVSKQGRYVVPVDSDAVANTRTRSPAPAG